jgi:uncharacterized protein YjbI with pentapeptide repeats
MAPDIGTNGRVIPVPPASDACLEYRGLVPADDRRAQECNGLLRQEDVHMRWDPESVLEQETFDRLDLREICATGTRVLDCQLRSGTFTEVDLSRSSWRTVTWDGMRMLGVDLTRSTWVRVDIEGSVLAGCQMYGADLRQVVFRDCRIDGLNLRGARLREVTFIDCVLVDLDLGSATVRDVRWPGCRIDGLDLTGATLSQVDFRRAELGIARGFDRLRGAIVDTGQLVELAPALAAHLELQVRDGDLE